MSKIEPAVQTITLTIPVNPTSTVKSYADLSQIASLLNRRFYRQGINWAVAGIKILNVNGVSGDVSLEKLPNTWVMANSWEKSFRAWSRMNAEAMSEAESIRPRFLDFKVYADGDHHAVGTAANLMPLTLAGLATPGEWEYSKFVIPKTNSTDDAISHEVVAVGPNYPGTGASGLNAVSLIEGYAASRGLPNVLDPNTPDDAADASGSTPQNYLAALFNDGTDQTTDVIDDLITENNLAPYPFENDGANLDTMYPGGANQLIGLQLHDVEYFTPTTISNTVRLKGGNFPCGLMKFTTRNTGPEPALFTIILDLIPGSHRGYLCEAMTEM